MQIMEPSMVSNSIFPLVHLHEFLMYHSMVILIKHFRKNFGVIFSLLKKSLNKRKLLVLYYTYT